MALKIKISNTFLSEVEDIVWELDVNYIDAVILWCERNNLELEVIGGLIKKNQILRAKIMGDAEDLNFMPKRLRLPV
jgi:hypothetical protein